MTTVAFAGMSHLGILSLAAAAAKGFDAVGFDPDAGLVARLDRGDLPVSEPGLADLFAANETRLSFTSDDAALSRCDIVTIAADVPTDDDAKSDLAPIRALIERVGRTLRRDAALVVLSQVPPGFTRRIDAAPHDRLFYQVETLIFGRAVERALHPERFIVGCAAPEAPLPRRYREFLEDFGCPILPMRYESAELAKTAINICLVAQVSVANTLAELCAGIGADWAEIVPALRLDRRIGHYAYLEPGLGISGGNLERDLRTVREGAASVAADAGVIDAFLAHSRHAKNWCWRVVEPMLRQNPKARIAVLGLAYKENTHSTKNAPSLALLSHLAGSDVRVHDPVVPGSVAPFATPCATPLLCAEGADILVLVTPWPLYRELLPSELARAMRGRVLVDPFRLIDAKKAAAAGFEHHVLGRPAAMVASC